MRIGFLFVSLLAVGFSNGKTIDPVSRKFYGTLQFGTHRMLNMGRYFIRDAPNNDAEIYNFEFLKINDLAEQAFADIRPTQDDALVGAPLTDYFWPGRLDVDSYRRTMTKDNSFQPNYMDDAHSMKKVRAHGPHNFYYFEWPNITDPTLLDWLKVRFPQQEIRTYSQNGYQLKVDTFRSTDPEDEMYRSENESPVPQP